MHETPASAPLSAHQKALVVLLEAHEPADDVEEVFRQKILRHVRAHERWWHRDTVPGHVTASAFIVDASLSRMLLHHHRKLDRWLQLGGHDDGERSPVAAVAREVAEESGLASFRFYDGPKILDLDIHAIPARGSMPAHDHLDVRFLLVADPELPLRRDAEESLALAWFPLVEAIEKMGESGARRVEGKIRALQGEIASR